MTPARMHELESAKARSRGDAVGAAQHMTAAARTTPVSNQRQRAARTHQAIRLWQLAGYPGIAQGLGTVIWSSTSRFNWVTIIPLAIAGAVAWKAWKWGGFHLPEPKRKKTRGMTYDEAYAAFMQQ